MAVSVLCLFLVMQWFGMWSVIVASTGRTHLPFEFVCVFVFLKHLTNSSRHAETVTQL